MNITVYRTRIGTKFRENLISRFWQNSILRGFIFAISVSKFEKFRDSSVLNLILFFKRLNVLKYRDKKKQTK